VIVVRPFLNPMASNCDDTMTAYLSFDNAISDCFPLRWQRCQQTGQRITAEIFTFTTERTSLDVS
jgi:hypothetical protein